MDKSNKGLSLTLHPDAFLKRRLRMPNIGYRDMPRLKEEDLIKKGVKLHKTRKASILCSNLVLALGETERVTDFEIGFPLAEANINGKWIIDPLNDDQALAVHVKGKGLIILGGCSHAGIINSIKYAQKLTGIDDVHAVLGGFHLTGPIFEPIIERTIDEIKKLAPDVVVPMHCTGWKAINRFSQEIPNQFILNTVGTTYMF